MAQSAPLWVPQATPSAPLWTSPVTQSRGSWMPPGSTTPGPACRPSTRTRSLPASARWSASRRPRPAHGWPTHGPQSVSGEASSFKGLLYTYIKNTKKNIKFKKAPASRKIKEYKSWKKEERILKKKKKWSLEYLKMKNQQISFVNF